MCGVGRLGEFLTELLDSLLSITSSFQCAFLHKLKETQSKWVVTSLRLLSCSSSRWKSSRYVQVCMLWSGSLSVSQHSLSQSTHQWACSNNTRVRIITHYCWFKPPPLCLQCSTKSLLPRTPTAWLKIKSHPACSQLPLKTCRPMLSGIARDGLHSRPGWIEPGFLRTLLVQVTMT